jgi:hypothetical protein
VHAGTTIEVSRANDNTEEPRDSDSDDLAECGHRKRGCATQPPAAEQSPSAEGARLEIALTVCDGVLQISITVADPES